MVWKSGQLFLSDFKDTILFLVITRLKPIHILLNIFIMINDRHENYIVIYTIQIDHILK